MARKTKLNRGAAIITSQKPDGPSTLDLGGAESYKIVSILEGYRLEAEANRLTGPNSRDVAWLQNLDLYWNRFDYSKKAAWQSREILPEFPQYIDRFAAAMRMALVSVERFFTVAADGDDQGDLARVIRKMMVAILRRVGRSASGHPIDFLNFFEDAIKMGSLSMCSAIVTSKEDGEGGNYVGIDLEDPYNVWLDPTGRNLYRIRRVEMDLNELLDLGELVDGDGMPLYDQQQVEDCYASVTLLMQTERQKRTGTGQWVMSNRRPVILHEYYCTLIDEHGKCLGRNVLCVVANNKYLIRGPEKNPFWHGKDWLLAAPIVNVPLAPYGKSYAENFAAVTKTFNELTNLILDAIQTSAMKAWAIVPEALQDPSQVEEGIYPNVLWRLNHGEMPQDVLASLDMGKIPPEVFQVWQSIKKELQEGAAFNEMTLGQSAPKGRTTAAEVSTVDNNATSYIRSIASNIEHSFLEPLLDLVWKCALQHLQKGDKELRAAVGDKWFDTIYKMRKEFCHYKITFTCRGISGLLQKKQKLQDFMQFLGVIAQNQQLTQVFVQQFSPQRIMQYIADLMDVELDKLIPSDRERQIQEMQEQQQTQAQQQHELALKNAGPPQAPQAPQQMPPPEPSLQERLMEEAGKTHMKNEATKDAYTHKRKMDLLFEHAKPKPPPPAARSVAGGGGGPVQSPQQQQPAQPPQPQQQMGPT